MAITLNSTTSTITVDGTGSSQGTVQLYENTGNGNNFIAIAAPASVA